MLRAILAMSHIFNGIGSAVAAAIGAIITYWWLGQAVVPLTVAVAALATLLISNGGFIINDIFDLAIDRINRPDRPLPAGLITVRHAWGLYVVQTALGIGLGFIINPMVGGFAALIAIWLWAYSAGLKKRFLIGHLSIGLMGASMLPFGGLAAGSWIPALYTLPITLAAFMGREILKTAPDVEGDRAGGVDNLATRYGADTATRIGKLLLALCVAGLPFTQLIWPLRPVFLIVALGLIAPGTLLILYWFKRDQPAAQTHQILRLSKLLFLVVAAAWLLGALP